MGLSTPNNLSAAGDSMTETPATDHLDFGRGFRGWLRVATSFLTVLTLVLIGLEFIFSIYHPDMNDPDIWWHMRNAQYLFEHHQLPRSDMYSFTLAGHPWISHEWLAEIPFYLSYKAFGLVGLKSSTFVLLCTISLLLLYLCFQESGNFKASITACYYAAFLMTVSSGPRTILFGYVYLLLLLVILQRFRRRGHAPLWAIPLLFCAWVNSHGSWAIGLIVFFLISVSGLVGGQWGRIQAAKWTRSQLRALIVTGVASVAALFVNPFGWRLVYYPFDFASAQKPAIMRIEEWISLDFHELRGKLVIVLLFGLITAALVRKRRWNLGSVLVLLFGLYLGLTYVRFLVLLSILAGPVIAQILDFFPLYRPQDETPDSLYHGPAGVMPACFHRFVSRMWVPDLSPRETKREPVSAIRFSAATALFSPLIWAGSASGPTMTKSLYMTSRRLSILPSATYFFSSSGACTSATSASPRAASASACPVPTETVFTVYPVWRSNMGTSTSSNPESCVLVVVDRITTLDCAQAGATALAAASTAVSSVEIISRRFMTASWRASRRCQYMFPETP